MRHRGDQPRHRGAHGGGGGTGHRPVPILIERARELAGDRGHLAFAVGDGHALQVEDESFDAVVLHRVLSHVAEPRQVVAEAVRALRPGGRLALFDGDYATITLAVGDHDPLQACVDAFRPAYITDPWIARRFPALARGAGLSAGRIRSYGFVQIDDPDYMLSIADRGSETLAAAGTIGPGLAGALRAEARRRVAEHTFYGHVAYASLIASKPD
jgi:SAM-dependent methyltransferase